MSDAFLTVLLTDGLGLYKEGEDVVQSLVQRTAGPRTFDQCCGSGIRIRIHWIHTFLGLPDPDPLVRGMDPDPDPALDPDPSIIMQK